MSNAFRGFKNGVYKYEFLEYFDTIEQKNEWLEVKRAHFYDQVRLSKEAATRDSAEADAAKKSVKVGKKRTISSLETAGDEPSTDAATFTEMQDLMVDIMSMPPQQHAAKLARDLIPRPDQPPVDSRDDHCQWYCKRCKSVVELEAPQSRHPSPFNVLNDATKYTSDPMLALFVDLWSSDEASTTSFRDAPPPDGVRSPRLDPDQYPMVHCHEKILCFPSLPLILVGAGVHASDFGSGRGLAVAAWARLSGGRRRAPVYAQ